MTIQELHVAFKDGIDKVSSLSSPIFEESQVNRYLNIGLERFVKQRFGSTNPKGTSFEENEKRTDDLRSLVTYAVLFSTGEGFFSTRKVRTKVYKLPLDYWFGIINGATWKVKSCVPTVTVDACSGKKTTVYPETEEYAMVYDRRHGEVNELLDDPYHRPEGTEAVRTIAGDEIQLYHDAAAFPINYKLGYIRAGLKLVLGQTYSKDASSPTYWKKLQYWMPDHTHQEIVNIAVQAATEATENPRYATFPAEVAAQE